MDHNLMPKAAQPVNRFTTGQLPAELAELSEEALQLFDDSASVLASDNLASDLLRSLLHCVPSSLEDLPLYHQINKVVSVGREALSTPPDLMSAINSAAISSSSYDGDDAE